MFGLFANHKKRATDAGIAALHPLIAHLRSQAGPGIATGFWEDPYILGFCSTFIWDHATVATGNKMKLEDRTFALVDVFSAVSNLDGKEVMTRALALSGNHEFQRGSDDAVVFFRYKHRLLSDEDSNSFVQIAKIGAKAIHKTEAREHVATMIAYSTLYARANKLAGRIP